MRKTRLFTWIFAAVAFVFGSQGCGPIQPPDFPYIASPQAVVSTPSSPASGDVAVTFHVIDRELELADITVEYSTDGGKTFNTAALVNPLKATNLESSWHPGETHTVQWDSVSNNLALSGDASVRVKIIPSDVSNASGTAGVSSSFTLNNIAYNQPPVAAVTAPAGVEFGNIAIDYSLIDVEGDTCTAVVHYSTDNGGSWYAAAMWPIGGDGLSGLSSSPAGTDHIFVWDSRADGVAFAGQLDMVKIKVTPTDFHEGNAGESNSFSVDNTIVNQLPTVAITSGPADGSTVYATQVAFSWSGSDADGTVLGYNYSFDIDPPDIWTTGTSADSGFLAEGGYTFRVAALDDKYEFSLVESRTFTVSYGTINADFTASTTSGDAPLVVSFTDMSTATLGIDSWLWNFGDGATSTEQNPVHTYNGGTFTVKLTVTGLAGSDTMTKTNYIDVIPASPYYYWTHRIGDVKDDKVSAICSDADGNFYIAGSFSVTTINFAADWGGTDIKTTGPNVTDVFITKTDPNGGYCWTHIMGGPGYDPVSAICADGNNNIYVAGSFTGTINFAADWGGSDTKTDAGFNDIFVTKIDAAGNYYWTRRIGGSESDEVYTICADGSGNVYMAGSFEGSVNVAADWGESDTKTGKSMFITKIDINGDYCWTRCIGNDSLYDTAYAICADESGNVYVAGRFNETVNFAADWGGSDSKTSAGYTDAFVTKIDASGDYCWTYRMGGTEWEYACTVCSDLNGNIFLAGNSGAMFLAPGYSVNFAADWGGSDTKVGAGKDDAFITKVDNNGSYYWTRRIGGASTDSIEAVCTDKGGNVYVTGFFFDSTVNFAADWGGSDSKTSAGSADIFITKLDASSNYCWTRRIGSSNYERAHGICAQGSGNVCVTGQFRESVNFAADWGGSDSKTSAGLTDVFITKIK